jgi:hypothetical protein
MDHEDTWLAELREIYEEDKVRREAEEARAAAPAPADAADALLQRCRAHELMRQVQKTLLNGGGSLHFYKNVGGYEQAIVLMWKGPLSAAQKPATIAEVDASLIVGATATVVFVNDEPLVEISADALRAALLARARHFLSSGPVA